MRVLLLSAYDAGSHRRWRRGLVQALCDWHWQVLTLPPRYFSWRVRGNSLSWGRGDARAVLESPWDLLVATSMTDLSALRGLVPALGRVPALVYFHENQFAYPRSERAFSSVEPQLCNLYTALAADRILFNSAFNRDTLLAGAAALLRRLPDQVPAGLCEEIRQKSAVLPVPLEDRLFSIGAVSSAAARSHGPLTISWAARWEYDKGAGRLLEILHGLEAAGVDFRLNLLGESFRTSPPEFARIQAEFRHRLLALGYLADVEEYRRVLADSDVFLSTSEHEFQGLAVMEAAALGCCPLVPDEQVYPELYPAPLRYSDSAAAVRWLADAAVAVRQGQRPPAPDVSGFRWSVLSGHYREALLALARKSGSDTRQ